MYVVQCAPLTKLFYSASLASLFVLTSLPTPSTPERHCVSLHCLDIPELVHSGKLERCHAVVHFCVL